MAKRSFDLMFAVPALAITAPLIAVLALLVRLESPGPMFHRGTRMGRGARPFQIYKLRSMRAGAASGRAITVAGDDRVTRVGGFLRATKLDELPQLWNVVRGDMSLVGPRPEHPSYLPHYSPAQRRLLEVRPGITSPASVAFRGEQALLSGPDPERVYLERILPAKLDIELRYLERAGVRADLAVILETLAGVVRPGAPPPPGARP